MQRILFALLICIVSTLLVGCGPRQLNRDAQNVYLYTTPPPQSCKFLGSIRDPNVHGDVYLLASPQDLQKDDNNFLRNEGAKLGANLVVLVSHKTTETKRKVSRNKGTSNIPTYMSIYTHSICANAYFCPKQAMHKLKQQGNIRIVEHPLASLN